MKMRLQKLLSQHTGYSRRQIEGLIKIEKITINGKIANLGDKADIYDKIKIDNELIKITEKQKHIYLVLNKPVGYVCTKKFFWNEKNIYSLLPKEYHHLDPVGRLDKESEGLLILTNDGDFLYQHTHPKFTTEKEYIVEVDKKIDQQTIEVLKSGVNISKDEKPEIVSCKDVKLLNMKSFKITITQGKNRQIRRMCASINLMVISLKRIREGDIILDNNLKTGSWKILNS